jgi:hypothetical protein
VTTIRLVVAGLVVVVELVTTQGNGFRKSGSLQL